MDCTVNISNGGLELTLYELTVSFPILTWSVTQQVPATPVVGWVGPQNIDDLQGYLRTCLPSCARMQGCLRNDGSISGAVNLPRQILTSVDIMSDDPQRGGQVKLPSCSGLTRCTLDTLREIDIIWTGYQVSTWWLRYWIIIFDGSTTGTQYRTRLRNSFRKDHIKDLLHLDTGIACPLSVIIHIIY